MDAELSRLIGCRPVPRLLALVPMVVTDDVEVARRQAAEQLGIYGISRSYRTMLDGRGWGVPEDAALIGTEDSVREQPARYDQEGVTEVGIHFVVPRHEHGRTRALIAARCRSSTS
jgi:5,10-methylenetetrahydromethanopterin reductase